MNRLAYAYVLVLRGESFFFVNCWYEIGDAYLFLIVRDPAKRVKRYQYS
jgi:hypothetical protein